MGRLGGKEGVGAQAQVGFGQWGVVGKVEREARERVRWGEKWRRRGRWRGIGWGVGVEGCGVLSGLRYKLEVIISI